MLLYMESTKKKKNQRNFFTFRRYKGFPIVDQPNTDISHLFYIASTFIENGIKSGGEAISTRIDEEYLKCFSFLCWLTGKVLVHCKVGMSRSATCVVAHLMISHKMSADEAIQAVRIHRDIHPNEGFLLQLADLDNKLKNERSNNG